jgi:LysM repeat protein
MHRVAPVLLPALLLGVALTACGDEGDAAVDTLPTIYTTTSTTTTTTTPDSRRRFWEVQQGENLAEIARAFCVPASEIVKLNNLPDNGNLIQVGQLLEIPTDVVLVNACESTTTSAP